MSNPFVFVVGCSRSGTTLLQHIIRAHPRIAIIPETRWFVRWFERRCGLTPDNYVTSELVSRLLKKHRLFRDLNLGIQPETLYRLVGSGRNLLFQDFVKFFFDRYGEAQGKPLVGNKTPGYVRRLFTIHKLWPNAKFVHIIRDGRDVCLSMMEKRKAKGKVARPGGRFATWDEDPVTTAALWWEWDVRLGREAGTALGSQLYYEMRYEALVTRQQAECVKLCGFLGVPYHDTMLRHHEGRVKTDDRLAEKHPRLAGPIMSGLRNWQREMCADAVERFEASAGPLLEELGYLRGAPRPPRQAMEWAARLRSLYAARPLPQHWSTEDPEVCRAVEKQ